jgi:hypothetical protein
MEARTLRPPLIAGSYRQRWIEEEGGGLSPPLSRWRRNAAGAIIVTAIYTNNFAAVNTNSLPLYAAV